MPPTCPKCGGRFDPGFIDNPHILSGLTPPTFVLPGTPPAPTFLAALKQGLADEPVDTHFRLDAVRCRSCGYVELYAQFRQGG